MIAFNPQFTSLLVALTASTVGAMPTSASFTRREERNARMVLDLDLPPVDIDAHANLLARSSSAVRRHEVRTPVTRLR